MRAKMSKPHVSEQDDRCSDPQWFRVELATAAVDEARAILRETEPGTDGWGDIPYVPFGDERAALAESLAAFLED